MTATLAPANDLELLSPRERAVVELAVEGMTDEQIAQSLEISPSTVNSYWVRIRGKIGQLSRTEIVGNILRQEMKLRVAALTQENETLRKQIHAAREAESGASTALALAGGADWSLLAIDHLPMATLVVSRPGIVRFANRQALKFLGAKTGDLQGRPVWDLTLGEDQAIWEDAVRRFFEDPELRRAVAGVERSQFAKRQDGTTVRVTLSAESFETSEGLMAVVQFRNCKQDVEDLMALLTRAIA